MKRQTSTRSAVKSGLFARMPFGPPGSIATRVAYKVSAYPATSPTKYGTASLTGSPGTIEVALSGHASGEPIRLWPHHPFISLATGSLNTSKIVTIEGLDFYGKYHNMEMVLPAGVASLHSAVEFSKITRIAITDDGGDNGKTLRFGDGSGSGLAVCPMFGMPLPITSIEPGIAVFARPSAGEEWAAITFDNATVLRNPSVGCMRGGIRPHFSSGAPNGVREYLMLFYTWEEPDA